MHQRGIGVLGSWDFTASLTATLIRASGVTFSHQVVLLLCGRSPAYIDSNCLAISAVV